MVSRNPFAEGYKEADWGHTAFRSVGGLLGGWGGGALGALAGGYGAIPGAIAGGMAGDYAGNWLANKMLGPEKEHTGAQMATEMGVGLLGGGGKSIATGIKAAPKLLGKATATGAAKTAVPAAATAATKLAGLMDMGQAALRTAGSMGSQALGAMGPPGRAVQGVMNAAGPLTHMMAGGAHPAGAMTGGAAAARTTAPTPAAPAVATPAQPGPAPMNKTSFASGLDQLAYELACHTTGVKTAGIGSALMGGLKSVGRGVGRLFGKAAPAAAKAEKAVIPNLLPEATTALSKEQALARLQAMGATPQHAQLLHNHYGPEAVNQARTHGITNALQNMSVQPPPGRITRMLEHPGTQVGLMGALMAPAFMPPGGGSEAPPPPPAGGGMEQYAAAVNGVNVDLVDVLAKAAAEKRIGKKLVNKGNCGKSAVTGKYKFITHKKEAMDPRGAVSRIGSAARNFFSGAGAIKARAAGQMARHDVMSGTVLPLMRQAKEHNIPKEHFMGLLERHGQQLHAATQAHQAQALRDVHHARVGAAGVAGGVGGGLLAHHFMGQKEGAVNPFAKGR